MSAAPSFADRWRRMEQILDASYALPEDQRKSFLEAICGSDDQLRQDVESLLGEGDADETEDSPLIARIIEDATTSLLDDDDAP
jgi:hypothetical protein